MKKLPLIAASGIILLALAGCTATETTAGSTPNPSAPSTGSAEDYVFPEVDGECIDGTATISTDSSSSIVTLGDCENVVIDASNSKIIVGDVTNLTMNSSISIVEAASVEHVTFTGQGNRVVTASEPVVEGELEKNTVTAE